MSETPAVGGEIIREPSVAGRLSLLVARGRALREPAANPFLQQEHTLDSLPPELIETILQKESYERWVELQSLRKSCVELTRLLPEERALTRLAFEVGFALASVNLADRMDDEDRDNHFAPFLRAKTGSPALIVSPSSARQVVGGKVKKKPHLYGVAASEHVGARVVLGIELSLTPHGTTQEAAYRVAFDELANEQLLITGFEDIKTYFQQQVFDRGTFTVAHFEREVINETWLGINVPLILAIRAAGYSLDRLGVTGEVRINIAADLKKRVENSIDRKFLGESEKRFIEALFAVDRALAVALINQATKAGLL